MHPINFALAAWALAATVFFCASVAFNSDDSKELHCWRAGGRPTEGICLERAK